MDLVIASNNNHKVSEIKSILKGKFDNIYSLSDKGINIEIDETGTTFYDNALIKAETIAKLVGMPVIADDSGLSVNALNGEPGVYSARYAGYPCDDKANNDKLIKELSIYSDRSAEFISEVVLYIDSNNIVSGKGTIKGEILFEGRGDGGFGYDPLFYCYELNMTFAEATLDDKNKVSHRARALADLISKL